MSTATYSRRGFIATLSLAAVVSALSGLVAYLSSGEEVSCTRAAGSVDCTVTQRLAGAIPLRTRVLRDVRDVTVATSRGPQGAVGRNRRPFGPDHRLVYVTVGPTTHAGARGDAGDLRSVAERLRRLIDGTGDVDTFAATVRGQATAHRWSVGFLIFGLALVPLWVLGYFFPALRPVRRLSKSPRRRPACR